MNTHRKKGIQSTEGSASPKKLFPFTRLLVPQKGESKRKTAFRVFLFLFSCVFLVCIAIVIDDLLIKPAAADRNQQAVEKIYYGDTSSAKSSGSAAPVSSTPPERDAQGRLIRFLQLQKVNPDITGWIHIPNTNIDQPVLQAKQKEPQFYLNHDYKKDSSDYGSIFADASTKITDNNAKSVILYGHSLNSGRMFTQLNKYKNYAFLKANPVITFDTADGASQWKIISVMLTNTLPDQGKPFDYMKSDFKNDSDYLNFVYQLRTRSLFNTGVSFNADDQILLLSTCSYEFPEFREVVAARKVRSGESGIVDLSRVLYNNKVVFPDCWYKKNGGEKPEWPVTYEQASKNKVLSWGEWE